MESNKAVWTSCELGDERCLLNGEFTWPINGEAQNLLIHGESQALLINEESQDPLINEDSQNLLINNESQDLLIKSDQMTYTDE